MGCYTTVWAQNGSFHWQRIRPWKNMSRLFGIGFAVFVIAVGVAAFGQNAVRSAESSTISDWHAMGKSPCAWSEALEKADHSLDIPRMIDLLKQGGFRCHAMPIIAGPPYSWAEFQQLVAAANAAGIDEWPVLIPPTEGSSAPYKHDFESWMQALAKLSVRYPHLRGANVDDLDQGENAKLFSRDYICRVYKAKQAINPKLLFVPTIYSLDRAFADRMSGCVDGVWLWWSKLDTISGLAASLQQAKAAAAGRFPVYGGVYAHWTSWHKQGPPTASVFQQTLRLTCELADGAVMWKILLQPPDPLLRIARSFTADGASSMAGRCGNSGSGIGQLQ
jgi:hypothetical protein